MRRQTVVSDTDRIECFSKRLFGFCRSINDPLASFRNFCDSRSFVSTGVWSFSSTTRFWPMPFDCFICTLKSLDEIDSPKRWSCFLGSETVQFELPFEKSKSLVLELLLVHVNRYHHAVESGGICLSGKDLSDNLSVCSIVGGRNCCGWVENLFPRGKISAFLCRAAYLFNISCNAQKG